MSLVGCISDSNRNPLSLAPKAHGSLIVISSASPNLKVPILLTTTPTHANIQCSKSLPGLKTMSELCKNDLLAHGSTNQVVSFQKGGIASSKEILDQSKTNRTNVKSCSPGSGSVAHVITA